MKGPSDRRDSYTEESVVSPPKEGEGYSSGRGGAGNVHPANGKAKTGLAWVSLFFCG